MPTALPASVRSARVSSSAAAASPGGTRRVGFDEAEVENLRSARGQQDVGGLDIAVDDAGGMSRLKGVGEGRADLEEDPQVQRAVPDSLLQGLTLEQLHDNECPAIGRFADVVDRADVGVLQGCHCLRFALESLASSSRIGGMRRQQLDGHVSCKSLVTRLVDLAHATRTDGGNDLVRAEAGASSACECRVSVHDESDQDRS